MNRGNRTHKPLVAPLLLWGRWREEDPEKRTQTPSNIRKSNLDFLIFTFRRQID